MATLWTHRCLGARGNRAVLLPEPGDVRAPRMTREGARPLGNDSDDLGYLFVLDDGFLLRPDIPDKTAWIHHGRRHVRLERSIAEEYNRGLEIMFGNAGQLRDRLDVLVVLAEGILEPVRHPEYLLGPLRLIFRSEYPALVVLGLDHEYSVPGYNDVVDLGRAIFRGEHDVADDAIDIPVQAHYQDAVDKKFPEPAFDLRLEKPCQGSKSNKGECKNGVYL